MTMDYTHIWSYEIYTCASHAKPYNHHRNLPSSPVEYLGYINETTTHLQVSAYLEHGWLDLAQDIARVPGQ